MRHICAIIALICANCLSATIYYNDNGSPDYKRINEDMKQQTDFSETNSKYGLVLNEFSDLPKETKEKLIKLMSRIMERAYRRGVQQALFFRDEEVIESWIKDDPHEYRYTTPLSTSYGLDGYKTTSRERLFIEENLESIGFDE